MQSFSPPSRIRRYRLLSLLGCTRNSFVYVALNPDTSQKIAIKLIHHTLMPMERIENECAIQRNLKHAYIMPLCDAFDYMDFRAMIMPRAAGGSLFDFIQRGNQRNPKTIASIMYRMFKAVHYLHSLRILHGDIKPSNVLLDDVDCDEPIPLFVDFGHACALSSDGLCHCRLMTCSYSSPELLGLKAHGMPSDVWSLAATVYFMVCGRELLKMRSLDAMCKDAAALRLSFDDRVWEAYPVSLRSMLAAMLKKSPDDRLTIRDCLEHRFFRDALGDAWLMKENEAVRVDGNRKQKINQKYK